MGTPSTRRTIPASTKPASYSSSPCGVQGIVRTRVSKRRRDAASAAKNLKLAFTADNVNVPVNINTKNPPPCSPVSTAPPSPSPRSKPAVAALPPLEDRLSLSYVPLGRLVGREEEERSIRASLDCDDAKSLYICGVPGTGKSLTVSKIVRDGYKHIWVNCANLKKPKDLYARVAKSLDIDLGSDDDVCERIRNYIGKSENERVVIVLDEVDFLTTKDQLVLYAAFEWAKNPVLKLVGIANALDLPLRLLPWLRANGCLPTVFTFHPYSSEQLQRIVQQRLGKTSTVSVPAVKLASKKVAASSGDARAVLDVMREAITNGAGGIGAVARVTSSIAACGASNSAAIIRDLPVIQQLALCAAANAVTAAGSKKRATLGGLHAGFSRLCARAHVPVLPFADFADVCTNALAHHGLLDVPATKGKRAAKTQRGRQVRLRVAVEDVRAGVADKGFLPFLVQ